MSFPVTAATAVQFTAALPRVCDAVVIGGGVIGVMSAWFLAKRGLRVVVCEKGRIAGEQSSRNWGWVRQQGRDPAELPLMIEANRIWQGLAAETGEDLGFRQTGVLYLANTARDMAGFEAWMDHARAHQLDTRLLNRAAVRDLLPTAAADWPGGLLTPNDGRAEPGVAVPALARAVVRMGVTVIENCAVRTLDIAAGRVAGVMTERGRIACHHVVLAGGAWSALFARNCGIDLPQLSVRATVAATVPLAQVFAGNAADSHFAFRRRADGGYTLAPGAFHEFLVGPDALRHLRAYLPQLRKDPFQSRYLPASPAGYPDGWRTPRRWTGQDVSPFEAMRVLDPAPNMAAVVRFQDCFAAAFPQIGRPPIRQAWAGMIDTMPDVVPVIDHAAALPGLTIATGMSGHGFGIGPGVGRVVADLVTGRPPGHDLSRFRLSRFSDGSRIVIGPSL